MVHDGPRDACPRAARTDLGTTAWPRQSWSCSAQEGRYEGDGRGHAEQRDEQPAEADAAEEGQRHKHLEVGGPHQDVYVAIRDALKEMQRQLQDYVHCLRQEVKTHHPEPLAES